jgi:DNA-binding GntR family transcriptional regulator
MRPFITHGREQSAAVEGSLAGRCLVMYTDISDGSVDVKRHSRGRGTMAKEMVPGPPCSRAQHAYERIRMAILKGELPLGASISRRQLAGQLDMSMVPVGEALQRLETDGLVESRPRSGTVVRRPSREDIRGHYVVREALETQAARLFAEKARGQERTELLRAATELDQAYADRQRDIHDTFLMHSRFHHRIAECAGCPALLQAIEKSHVLVLNWLYNGVADFYELPRHWHRDLAKVLSGSDPNAADSKMREHVRYALDDVLLRLEAGHLLQTPLP